MVNVRRIKLRFTPEDLNKLNEKRSRFRKVVDLSYSNLQRSVSAEELEHLKAIAYGTRSRYRGRRQTGRRGASDCHGRTASASAPASNLLIRQAAGGLRAAATVAGNIRDPVLV
jgi:hypothetical protein